MWFNLEIALRAAAHAGGRRARAALGRPAGTVDLFLCVADHFEPQVGRAPRAKARERLEEWLRRYPRIAAARRDHEGRPPAHSFFYPWDEYDPWEMERLAQLCAAGWGEIELHLHHRDDSEATLRRKLAEAARTYAGHGAFTRWPDGRAAFGFIHGDWALDNSRRDGGRNYCGVDSELTLLAEAGCYADFTFPAWQHAAQPRTLNAVYYAVDDPARPKSYDRGTRARAGRTDPPGLLLIQGPLVPYRRGRRPAMDDGDLAAYRRYHPERLDRWVRAGIHVAGRPEWIFVKLHCHGAQDANRAALLDEDLPALFADAEARYNDGERYRLHHVTARELFNVVKAAEAGVRDAAAARDWLLPPPSSRAAPAAPHGPPGFRGREAPSAGRNSTLS